MSKIIVGATASQLAMLNTLFPHQGGDAMIQGDPYRAAPTRHIVGAPARTAHDARQIRVAGEMTRITPQSIVGLGLGAPHDARQIIGALQGAMHDRRQIVGAHVIDDPGEGEFVEVFLPLTSGVGAVAPAAGASSNFELKPNKLFLPMALCLSAAIAPNLVMSNLAIGGNPCLLTTGVIPCDQFAPTTVHKPFKSWSASNAQPITFTLTNIHASAAQTIYGAWAGIARV